MIGARLKAARAASGLSLRQLEARIGKRVTAQMIGNYERDEAEPPDDVLSLLAAALGASVANLRQPLELSLDGVEFRRKASTTTRERTRLEGQTIQTLTRYLAIEAALGMASVAWDKPREAPYPVHSMADADNAARAIRSHWSLGIDPIPKLAELLEERGIKVISVDLDDVSGMAARVRRATGDPIPVIVVNSTHWSERKRFTLAHELGHMLLDATALGDEKQVEKAAHRFAGAFLMPAEVLWSEIGKRRSSISIGELVQLKRLLGVSIQSIVYRCRDLDLINDYLLRQLFQEFSRRGWRSPPYEEPELLPRDLEEPRRLERLTYRAFAEGLIEAEAAAEALGCSVDELKSRMAGGNS